MTDDRLVDWVLVQPPEQRVGKRLLKDAMRGLLPDAIIDRTDKRGFPVPFVEWAQHEPVRSFMLERIGYLPSPLQPWSRGYWYDLCYGGVGASVR